MEKINDLKFSHRFIALNNFSMPCDKSGEPQKDSFAFSVDEDDLTILGILASVDVAFF
jgi:hypothetical protein